MLTYEKSKVIAEIEGVLQKAYAEMKRLDIEANACLAQSDFEGASKLQAEHLGVYFVAGHLEGALEAIDLEEAGKVYERLQEF